jgi:hypothetical protein
MAFPVLGTRLNGDALSHEQIIQLQKPTHLQTLRYELRRKLLDQTVPLVGTAGSSTQRDSKVALQLAQIAQILGRSAGNEPTIYDNGTSRSSASGSANAFTQQVERALTKVLGRTPGGGYDGFVNALNSAFPTDVHGKVSTTPARSIVSLSGNGNYSNIGNGFYSPSSLGNYPGAERGYSPSPSISIGVGQLSVEQANLYRQASINASDALLVLASLQPFDPRADVDAVEALRALICSQITSLVDEFGRIDEPRQERVETYLYTLTTDVIRFGNVARFIPPSVLPVNSVSPVTLSDDTQAAGFKLLQNYVKVLKSFWKTYREQLGTRSYSERLSRSYVMLPVISDSNTSFMAAMDSIGFNASERRSEAAKFSRLGATATINLPFQNRPSDFILNLPHITVNDFNEWVERFATLEAPSILSASGKFGLDFVADQADTLFWVIGIVLFQVKNGTPDELGKELSFERVKQTLNELLAQLSTLADFGIEQDDAQVSNSDQSDCHE